MNDIIYIKENECIHINEIKIGNKFYLDKTGLFEIIEIIPFHYKYHDNKKKRVHRSAKIRFYNCVCIDYYDDIFRIEAIINCQIKNRYFPSVCNIACIGNAKSRIDGKKKHLYRVWYGVIHRCYDIKSSIYNRYGAKGITVCNRWLCFEFFEQDAVNLPGYYDMINNPHIEYDLDKDILQQGFPYNQKIYSQTTCV